MKLILLQGRHFRESGNDGHTRDRLKLAPLSLGPDLPARKRLDELGVIRQPTSGRLNSSSRKTNDSYGRPVACRRPISQVRFAEI